MIECRSVYTILATSLMWVGPVSAYSVDNHRLLTQAAVVLYNGCAKRHENVFPFVRPISDSFQSAIISGNIGEDEKAPFDRFKIWHFYDPDNRLRAWKVVQGLDASVEFVAEEAFDEESDLLQATNFHAYFQAVETTLRRVAQAPLGKDGFLYDRVGKLIHYLQDMTVPAHVVPIFHPFPRLNGLNFHDTFDKYDVSFKQLLVANVSLNCQDLFAQTFESLEQIIHEMARRTLSRIRTRTWRCYWDETRNSRGFGTYGEAGNKFGWNLVWCHGGFMTVPESRYANFAFRQHRDAVDATLKAIVYLQRLMHVGRESPTPPISPTEFIPAILFPLR